MSSARVGVGELAEDIEGLELSIDVASLRSDKVTATAIAKAEESTEPELRAAMKGIDQIQLRSEARPEPGKLVAAFWGRMPKEPKDLFGKAAASWERAPALPNGTAEWIGEGGKAHLFAPHDGLWVVAMGSSVKTVREHFLRTKEIGPPPKGTRFKLAPTSNSREIESVLPGLAGIDAEMTPGVASVKAKLSFKNGSQAAEAQAKAGMFSSLILMAIAEKSKTCPALSKVALDVHKDGEDAFVIEVKGLGEAAEAWDSATCPRLGERSSGAIVQTPEARSTRPNK